MDSSDFFSLPFKDQRALLYKLNSKELTELREEVDNYIIAHGNNDNLQYLLDKTFSLGYLRGIEEENPGYSLV